MTVRRLPRRILARLLAMFRRGRLDRELEEDIRAHLELAEAEARARGLPPEEARRQAGVAFGSVERVREEHRNLRGLPWIETFGRDFRYGAAKLLRSPASTALIVGVLALGIGGTVATFSVVNAALLRPLPFPDPGNIVRVWEAPAPGAMNATTVAQFVAWRSLASSFTAMAAEQSTSATLDQANGAVLLAGDMVTPGYFKVFGLTTSLGRSFDTEDERAGAAPALVLSHATWQAVFGGDPDILRHPVRMGGQNCRVVGVLAPSAFDRGETKFWEPLRFTAADYSSAVHRLQVVGRMRRGVSLEAARQQMESIYGHLQADSGLDEAPAGAIVVERMSRLMVGGDVRQSILISFGAMFMVLLIACANVCNLLCARGVARGPELAVRAALGAGPIRLVSQILTECLVLCAVGGIAGVAVAFLLIYLAAPVLAQSLPFTAAVGINFEVLAFTALLVLGVTMLAGTFPAFARPSRQLADFLQQASRTSSGRKSWVRRAIVVSEVALSLVLVVGALLMAKSLAKLQQAPTGVRVAGVLTASIHLPQPLYPDGSRAELFYNNLSRRLRSSPSIAQAGLSTALPLQWISNGEGFFVPGGRPINVRYKRVDSGYLPTLSIPVLAGRGVEARDRAGAPNVVVINQSLRARLTQAGIVKPLGRTLALTSTDYSGKGSLTTDVQIVGVVRDERTTSPGTPSPPVVYVPLDQSPNPNLKLVVRSRSNPAVVAAVVRNTLHEVAPGVALANVTTLTQLRRDSMDPVSQPAWFMTALAILAVLLAALGLYGLILEFVIAQRRDIGIRMALGARPGDVRGRVLRDAGGLIVTGVVLGLVGSVWLTGLLQGLLFEVSPLDPGALAAAAVTTATVGLLAGYWPARRAAKLDPATILREG